MRKKMVILVIVVFAVALAMPAVEAEQVAPGITKPRQQQVPPGATRLPSIVRGHVKYSGGQEGVQGIEIRLFKVAESGQGVEPGEMRRTDNKGFYSFTLSSENTGKTYRIVPILDRFCIGCNIAPKEKTFTLTAGFNTIDFLFANNLL